MRAKVNYLFNYWHNTTKPFMYNVVSLPGDSFEFESHVRGRVGKHWVGEKCIQWMFETNSKVYNKHQKDYNEVINAHSNMFMELYLPTSISPLGYFKGLPTFAWYDFCGNATKERFNCIYNQDVNDNTVAVVTFNARARRPDLLHSMVKSDYFKNSAEAATCEYLTKRLPHVLFSHHYKQKSKGIPMVMIALTNSKTLFNVYNKAGHRFTSAEDNKVLLKGKRKPSKLKKNVKDLYMALLYKSDDAKIMKRFNITIKQLAGYKRTITHKRNQNELEKFIESI